MQIAYALSGVERLVSVYCEAPRKEGALIHVDLFSGIGGFALAVDEVFDNVEHIFCDNEPFARAVINKHWKGSKIYHDIREIDADTLKQGLEGCQQFEAPRYGRQPSRDRQDQERPFILTGGFPCQPFSAAGRRRGVDDDRYLWPEMLRVIKLARPTWVIAENVKGLFTMQGGVVFEQVCADLEAEGYEVQPFIIPAVSVGAPHRRDRIWFVAHRRHDERWGRAGRQDSDEKYGSQTETHEESSRRRKSKAGVRSRHEPSDEISDATNTTSDRRPRGGSEAEIEKRHRTRPEQAGQLPRRPERPYSDASDSEQPGLQEREAEIAPQLLSAVGGNSSPADSQHAGNRTPEHEADPEGAARTSERQDEFQRRIGGRSTATSNPSGGQNHNRERGKLAEKKKGGEGRDSAIGFGGWQRDWVEVASELCSLDDGLPARLGESELSKSKHRAEQLKAYGNAIVPQVAIEIMRGIKLASETGV